MLSDEELVTKHSIRVVNPTTTPLLLTQNNFKNISKPTIYFYATDFLFCVSERSENLDG